MSASVSSLVTIYILSGVIFSLVGQTEEAQPTEIIPRKCKEFSIVNEEQKEFYSPGYPGNYTNDLECVLNITAEFGYQIRVDFRDYFIIEPSENCENDFLEIRDGPHGYSDLLGKFCDKSFPHIITSKDRHLWLRFSSDDTLIYPGFRAVYEFIKNPNIDREEVAPCIFNQGGVQGTIIHQNITDFRLNYSLEYSLPLDCTWTVEVSPDKKIYLFFESFKLDKPNECDQNYVDIFEGKRDMNSRLKHYCGSVADPVVTKGNLMYFRYYAIRATIKSEFTAYFTALRERIGEGDDKNIKCLNGEYDCEDATCIDASLECNGIRNCRHMYDEEGCVTSNKDEFDISSKHIVIILTLGCGLLAGMCFAMCYNCIKKLVRDGKQIHENIRRSREQLEVKRSASMASFQKNGKSTDGEDIPCFIEVKPNGGPCFHHGDEEQETDEEDDDEMEDLEDQCVEMRDCECQTRDTMIHIIPSHRGTPPPPPPPLRKPPNIPPMTPFIVPTPPPPPLSHYARHPTEQYFSHQLPHHFDGNITLPNDYKQKYRSETLIHMRDNSPRAQGPKPGKSTPDVLDMH